MSSTVTVRDLDPRDKSWLKREARRLGISMEEFIRRLIRERAREIRASMQNLPRHSSDTSDRNTASSYRHPPATAIGRSS